MSKHTAHLESDPIIALPLVDSLVHKFQKGDCQRYNAWVMVLTKMSGLQGCMLSGRAFTVVVISNYQPAQAILLVVPGNSGNGIILPSQLIFEVVDPVVLNVQGADEKVVGDVVQVTPVLEPGSSHTDVISSALALHFNEDCKILQKERELSS